MLFVDMQKLIINKLKIMIKMENLHIHFTLRDNIRKVTFRWSVCVENTPQHNKDFIKNYNKDSNERCFPEVDVQYSKKLHGFHYDLQFLMKK